MRGMPCFALRSASGNDGGLGSGQRLIGVVHGRALGAGTTLRDDVTCVTLTTTALGGYTQFKLDFVKTHPRMCVASNFTVRDAMAYTNNHGYKQQWLARLKVRALYK